MNRMDVLKEIFEGKGIFISEDAYEEPMFLESLQFVAIIIDIEEEFSIQIPDEYYLMNKLVSFHDFCEMIQTLLETEDFNRSVTSSNN